MENKKVVKMYGVINNGVVYTLAIYDDGTKSLYVCGVESIRKRKHSDE